MATKEFDFIVAGGGLAGCVVASRLKEARPSLSVALLERGPDAHDHKLVKHAAGVGFLRDTDLVNKFKSVPQPNYNGRQVEIRTGNLLSGSSAVNYGAFSRGNAADYDYWAKAACDPRWTYESMLPYFRKSEQHHDGQADPKQRGFSGPVHTANPHSRGYPLTRPLHDSLIEAGYKDNRHFQEGNPLGLGQFQENWKEGGGERQPSGKVYNLAGVDILTGVVVQKVIIGKVDGWNVARGVELADGRHLLARKEVIASCGAVRTPQLLMLSGIGPAQTLSSMGIPLLLESPEVGRNYFDHLALELAWKLRHPERDLALGSPGFNKPAYFDGLPTDWITGDSASEVHMGEYAMPGTARAHSATFYSWIFYGVNLENVLPFDGTHIGTVTLRKSAKSRQICVEIPDILAFFVQISRPISGGCMVLLRVLYRPL